MDEERGRRSARNNEEMSEIDAINAMNAIDRISGTRGGADGLWAGVTPKGMRDIMLNGGAEDMPPNVEQPPREDKPQAQGGQASSGRGAWRTAGRIALPIALTAALIITAVWGNGQRALAENYRQQSENAYRRAFIELCDHMDNLQTALGKLRVTAAPGQYMLLLDDIWRLSGACVSLMGQIPAAHLDRAELNSFVVRIGDYAHALSKKALNAEGRSAEDDEQLNLLYASCVRISRELNDRLSIGDIPTAAIANEDYYQSGDAEQGVKEDEDIAKFPTLIYDGPFSESSEKLEPRGLGGPSVTAEAARTIAQRLTLAADLESDGETGGSIPTWDFRAAQQDGSELYASISKQGGKLVWFMGSAAGNANGIPAEDRQRRLKAAAQDWLGMAGYDNMQATYAQYYGGAAVINFAATLDGIILYNDLVKVWVDMETEKVIGADARNYIFSHAERELETPAISAEEAEAKVSLNLEIEARALALIPLTVETEKLCYEFKGRCGDDEYIVYIDAQTGEERQIFTIINTENGQLTA